MVRRGLIAFAVTSLVAPLVAARVASAGGLALDLTAPRGVGRAGAGVVSDDGAASVVVNPAAMARRDVVRAQAALVVVDDDASYDAPGDGVVATARGPSQLSPALGIEGAVGPIVIGAALVDDARLSRRFAAPSPGQPGDDVEALYPHRYAGLTLAHHRRTLGLGLAWRATDWLAVGASVTVSQVELAESRRVWAGFGGRDRIGDATRDVTVELGGEDGVVPGGAVGVLVAPIDAPIELAASVAWADRARLSGAASAAAATPGQAPTVTAVAPRAEGALTSPLVARAGVRWLAERWSLELGAELRAYPGGGGLDWTIRGLAVVDGTGATASIAALPSRVARRRHGVGRVAADVEIVPGLVWLTAGWAWAQASTAPGQLSPTGADLGGHTGAVGAEITGDGVTVTIGVARTWAPATDAAVGGLRLDNPFVAGTAAIGRGRYDQGRDQAAVTVELELP